MKITNPAFDYNTHGQHYSQIRRADKHIAAHIHHALGNARTVLNVGAGAGSYEPDDKYVVAVEPSQRMREQRLQAGKTPAVNAVAGALPFDDNSFDAAMALVTVHHWPDIEQGLREMRRVTKNQVVIMTFDPDALHEFWNVHFFPELIEVEKARYPKIERITQALGTNCDVLKVPVTLHCTDGFQEAFYGRPEMFLRPEVRQSQSAWGFLKAGQEAELVKRLETALQSGEWDKQYGHLRTQPEYTAALRLIVAQPK
ncbi:MAG: class I SAM-dependent methyltransferase [Bacteroidia bacterium]|jgi:ubiquinone/menaquinone biosynthesis C-methylase UbiE|nr:class I SAM-dependent methyltransferase [Bacteroidia bacterium]